MIGSLARIQVLPLWIIPYPQAWGLILCELHAQGQFR